MKEQTWQELYKKLAFILITVKGLHCCPTLVEEVKELIGIMAHRYHQDYYFSPYSIQSVNVDLHMSRAHKTKNLRKENRIIGVLTKPSDVEDLLDTVDDFTSYLDYVYCIYGQIAIVANNFLYHVHFEQECGVTVYKIPV